MKIVGILAVGLLVYYIWCEMNKPGGLANVPNFNKRPVPDTTTGSLTIAFGNGWTGSATLGNGSSISTGGPGSGNEVTPGMCYTGFGKGEEKIICPPGY